MFYTNKQRTLAYRYIVWRYGNTHTHIYMCIFLFPSLIVCGKAVELCWIIDYKVSVFPPVKPCVAVSLFPALLKTLLQTLPLPNTPCFFDQTKCKNAHLNFKDVNKVQWLKKFKCFCNCSSGRILMTPFKKNSYFWVETFL